MQFQGNLGGAYSGSLDERGKLDTSMVDISKVHMTSVKVQTLVILTVLTTWFYWTG